MSHKQLISLIGAVVLAGCAASPGPTGEGTEDAVTHSLRSVASMTPDRELNGPLLYDLLVAEMSAQQGDLVRAAVKYQRVAVLSRDARLAARATQLAVYAREFGLAQETASLWVKLNPESLEARQSLSALLIGQDRTAEAMPHLRVLLASGEADATNRVVQALARARDKEAAMALMGQLSNEFPSPEMSLAHASLAAHSGQMEAASVLLGRILEREPENSEALLLLSRVQYDQGLHNEAAASVAKVLELEPDNRPARQRYARILVDLERYDEAREQFLQLQQTEGGIPDPEVTYALGLLAIQQDDLEGAEKYMLQLQEMGAFVDESALALGQIAEHRERWEEAAQWYGRVQNEQQWFKARLRGVYLLREKQGQEAALEALRDISPRTSEQEVVLVQAEMELLEALGRGDEAMARLDEALEVMPGNTELLYARAMLGERLGHLNILERDLRAILEAEPDNAQALNALGYTLADRTERHQEAYELLQRALELKPEDPAVLDSMGWVLYRLGRLEESLEYLRRAAELMQDGEISAHLGEVLWNAQRQEEARQVWERARSFESGQETLRRTIERHVEP